MIDTYSIYGKSNFVEPLGRTMAPTFLTSSADGSSYTLAGYPFQSGGIDITATMATFTENDTTQVGSSGTISIIG